MPLFFIIYDRQWQFFLLFFGVIVNICYFCAIISYEIEHYLLNRIITNVY